MPKRSFASFSIRELLLAITVIALAIPYVVDICRSTDEPLRYLNLDPSYFADWAKEIDPAARRVGRYYGGSNSLYGKNYFATAEVAANRQLHKQIADHWRMRIRERISDQGWRITQEISSPDAWQVTINQDHSTYQMYFYFLPDAKDVSSQDAPTLHVRWIELAYTDRRFGRDLRTNSADRTN